MVGQIGKSFFFESVAGVCVYLCCCYCIFIFRILCFYGIRMSSYEYERWKKEGGRKSQANS